MKKSFRQQIEDLGDEISGDIHHRECFYERDMLEEFLENLDKLKNLAKEYYIENTSEEVDEVDCIKNNKFEEVQEYNKTHGLPYHPKP